MEAWSPVGLGKEKSHRIRAFNKTMAGLRRFFLLIRKILIIED